MSSRKKTALVTGASSGIGYAVAFELASRGYQTFACARNLKAMEPLEAKGIKIFKMDVTNEQDIERVRALVATETDGYLDVLFNNAGQAFYTPLIDALEDTFMQAFNVNFFGATRVTRIFSSLVINAKGVIAFTGSLTGQLAFPFLGVYSATKSALHLYAETLRIEMQPFEVRVINLVTGAVSTSISNDQHLLPESLYNIDGHQELVDTRIELQTRMTATDVNKYARQVVTDFERQTVSRNEKVWRGSMASFMRYIVPLLPQFMKDKIIYKSFGVGTLFRNIKKQYAGVKLA